MTFVTKVKGSVVSILKTNLFSSDFFFVTLVSINCKTWIFPYNSTSGYLKIVKSNRPEMDMKGLN